MSDEGNQQPHYSLNEIKAMILEMQTRVGTSCIAPSDEMKLDVDGEDLIFLGERGFGHSCSAMGCGTNEHVVFRVSFANLLITRRAKKLVRNFFKDM